MVYELRCYTLSPGKMPEYLKAAETIGRPARGQNFGVNHGYWTAEFGALNQIWHLWKYDSYEERTRLRYQLELVKTRVSGRRVGAAILCVDGTLRAHVGLYGFEPRRLFCCQFPEWRCSNSQILSPGINGHLPTG